jgi:hypothetical protein
MPTCADYHAWNERREPAHGLGCRGLEARIQFEVNLALVEHIRGRYVKNSLLRLAFSGTKHNKNKT